MSDALLSVPGVVHPDVTRRESPAVFRAKRQEPPAEAVVIVDDEVVRYEEDVRNR